MDKIESSPEYEDAGASGPTHEPARTTIDLTPIRGLLERIEVQYHPLQIWLFGSRARGQAQPGSDWDLLILVADDMGEDALDPRIAWQLAKACSVRADLIPCRVTEFEESRDVVNTLSYEVAHTGMRIYGAN